MYFLIKFKFNQTLLRLILITSLLFSPFLAQIKENTLVIEPLPKTETSFCQDSLGAATCLGGGTCEEHDGTFTCYCPPGLAGDRCQYDLSKHDQIAVASFLGSGEDHFKTSPSYVVIKTPSDIIR